jgi:NADP-dependent 3-hydroxy acid dehydrogenase YdfG
VTLDAHFPLDANECSTMDLQDKVAVITGASGGIGEAIARDLRAQGCRLVLTARSADKLDALCRELGDAVFLAGEVTVEDLPDRLLALAIERFGQADILVNNAGVMTIGPVEDADVGKLAAMARINFEAVVRFAYTFLKPMKARGSGYVVNVSSVAGTLIPPLAGVYAGSKYAVEALSEALWTELTGTGVGLSVIEPGTVATGLYKDWDKASTDWVHSLGALRPEDIAGCVRFVLSQPDHVRIARMLALPAGKTA